MIFRINADTRGRRDRKENATIQIRKGITQHWRKQRGLEQGSLRLHKIRETAGAMEMKEENERETERARVSAFLSCGERGEPRTKLDEAVHGCANEHTEGERKREEEDREREREKPIAGTYGSDRARRASGAKREARKKLHDARDAP